MKNRAITVAYHDVVTGDNPDSSGFSGANSAAYTLTVDQFNRHLQAIKLASKGEIITAYELNKKIYSFPPVLLSFDDGGVGAYENIAPMLESYGWRGCFFIVTDKIGEPTFVSREQIKELYQRGHAIGSHSCSHPRNMAILNEKEMLDEWSRSLQVLSEIVGEEINMASIPSGFFSQKIAATAGKSGVKTLFTSEPIQSISSCGDCRIIGRFPVKRSMSEDIPIGYVTGNINLRLRVYLYWNLKKTAKRYMGLVYPWIRNKYLSIKM